MFLYTGRVQLSLYGKGCCKCIFKITIFAYHKLLGENNKKNIFQNQKLQIFLKIINGNKNGIGINNVQKWQNNEESVSELS